MVALSLRASKIPQKGDTKTEKTHDYVRALNDICSDFHTYLHDIVLYTQRWLGVTR